MKDLFLVQGEIIITNYEGSDSTHKEFKLVEANSKEEAVVKFSKFFEDKTDQYSTYYTVRNCICDETIR